MSSDPSPGPAERNEGVSPRGGDDWGQEAVLNELMAAFDSGLRQTATADRSDQVPDCMDAGFLPRGRASRPAITNLARGGRRTGFAPGAELDTALPGPAERVQLRYNYRLYPAPGQQQALAGAFGCARVVFNDGLRARQQAHAAGQPYLTDAELSARRPGNAESKRNGMPGSSCGVKTSEPPPCAGSGSRPMKPWAPIR